MHNVRRYKVRCLRKLLVHDVEMTDKELQDLICEIEEYKENMAKAQRHMKSTTSVFLSAHAATMEVLGVAGKVKYHHMFRKKGATEVRCMFCSMGIENMELRKKHIMTAHCRVFTATVSISHKYFQLGPFFHCSVIASADSCTSIFSFFRYQNMLIFGTCYIVDFAPYRGNKKPLIKNVHV